MGMGMSMGMGRGRGGGGGQNGKHTHGGFVGAGVSRGTRTEDGGRGRWRDVIGAR